MSYERFAQVLLAIASGIIVAIGISFGGAPTAWMPQLYDVPIDTTAAAQFARSVMGLILGVVALWVSGIATQRLRAPALLLLLFTMVGLVAGRLLSLVLDGTDVPVIFTVYLAAEALTAVAAVIVMRGLARERAATRRGSATA